MQRPTTLNPLYADLKNQEFTDCGFIFEVGDQLTKIAAHTNLLAVSSPVFKAMFYGDLKEEQPVKITDISLETFQKLIE